MELSDAQFRAQFSLSGPTTPTYPVPEAQWNFESADSISSQPWIFTAPTSPSSLYPSNSYSSQYSGYPQEASPLRLPFASKSPTSPLNSLSGPSLCLPTPTRLRAAWLGPPLCPPSP